MTPNWLTTTSNDDGSTSRACASACVHVAPVTRSAAHATIAGLRSVATTRASGSARTSAAVAIPVPAASSSREVGASAVARAASTSAYGAKSAGPRHSS